ncbi:MAG: hypothetical protein KDB73_19480 [Planctomycetes bacterium]|nr:hypothetical protein [Planctomycetota bacterium]
MTRAWRDQERVVARDVAETIRRLVGFEGRIAWDPQRPDGQPRRSLDTRRAAERLGWRAATSLEEGLRTTIAWYRGQSWAH